MSYPPAMRESINRVVASREARLKESFPRLSYDEIMDLLKKFHPDYRSDSMREVKAGPNKGNRMPNEVVDLLEAKSRIDPDKFDLNRIDYETDVLIIGGGGAACSAALVAQENGAKVLMVTKLRLGDANTMMAQGGIQAADKPNDSPAIHYVDVIGGGKFTNVPELVKALVIDAPLVIKWLEDLGMMFDKDKDGIMKTLHGGGTSRKRMHSARDYSGAEIMRVLRDEVKNRGVEIIEFSPAVELILDDKGQCCGAIIYNLETKEYFTIKAKTVIVATGGLGRLHIQGFPTTNHYGATADGLILAYRTGAQLAFMDAIQYHPTGVAYPEQIVGLLVTEKVRGLGAQLVNDEGKQFIFPTETRDVVSSAIIRECSERNKGVPTTTGMLGVWLDSPMIEIKKGSGTVKKELPAMFRQYYNFGIDMSIDPILIYPTLHYQNGGILINDKTESGVKNLFVAGEAAGGIHGRNRLMGNSLLDITVFGRRAGKSAALRAEGVTVGKMSLEHVKKFNKTLKEAGLETGRVAPMILPDYTRPETKARQLGTKVLVGLGKE